MEDILIRNMRETDIEAICREEAAQGWHPEPEKYRMRLADMAAGKSIAWVAEYRGEIAGYNNLYFTPKGGAYAGSGIPEIVDLGVFERFRNHGIGNVLMETAEERAKKAFSAVGIGVGLHSGYGSAQRMYVKRGYIPDGSGVWFRDKVCPQYSPCINDDDLVLYMKKEF